MKSMKGHKGVIQNYQNQPFDTNIKSLPRCKTCISKLKHPHQHRYQEASWDDPNVTNFNIIHHLNPRSQQHHLALSKYLNRPSGNLQPRLDENYNEDEKVYQYGFKENVATHDLKQVRGEQKVRDENCHFYISALTLRQVL